MAAGSPRKRLREEVTCALCSDFFTEPLLLDCGHNFCHACIVPSGGAAAASCPQCKEAIRPRRWTPNRQLGSVARIAQELAGEAGRSCQKHQEPLKLFCKDDEAPLCVVCRVSKGHRGHNVVPLEEAAQEYQVQICSCLENLRKEREKILEYKTEREKESEDLLKHTEAEKLKTVAEFRGLRQFLEEQENLLLAQMEGVVEEIVRNREEHLARISEELSSLDAIIREVEEKCQQIASELLASELLQDVTSTLRKYEQKVKFEKPVAFSPAVKLKLWEFRVINPSLEKIMKKLKGILLHENQLRKENVTLDPDSAHPQLLISDDLKCLTLGDQSQDLPIDSCRFQGRQCVQGKKILHSQMCYWDVEVGNEEGWAVGICWPSTVPQRDESLGPEKGIWAIGKWSGMYRTVSYPYNPPLSLSGEPKKIRVFLNFPEKQVSFFDADTTALLHTSPIRDVEFQPFFWLLKKSHLRICP